MTRFPSMIRISACAAVLASAILPAALHADEQMRYSLKIGLQEDGAEIANPRLVVAAGATAMFAIGDERDKVYNFSGQVTPLSDDKATVSFRYAITGNNASGAATTRAVESMVALDLGKRVEMQFGAAANGAEPMALSLQVDRAQ